MHKVVSFSDEKLVRVKWGGIVFMEEDILFGSWLRNAVKTLAVNNKDAYVG